MDVGRKLWVITAGQIPIHSTGTEPEFTSRDVLSLLYTGLGDINVRLTIFHPDKEPVGPYELQVKPHSARQLRINDLVDPAPLMLGAQYAVVVEAEKPVVVQFSRMNTSQKAIAICGTTAYAEDE